MSWSATHTLCGAAIAMWLATGCSDSPERRPPSDAPLPLAALAARSSGAAGEPRQLSLEARAWLDSGNARFRARKYVEARAAYSTAATLAPDAAAPYYGLYMVAERMGSRSAADSAREKLKALIAGAAADSALQMPHHAATR